jgi:hypothetical protein
MLKLFGHILMLMLKAINSSCKLLNKNFSVVMVWTGIISQPGNTTAQGGKTGDCTRRNNFFSGMAGIPYLIRRSQDASKAHMVCSETHGFGWQPAYILL